MTTVFNNASGPGHTDAKRGIKFGFVALIPFMWICFALALFLGNVWIKGNGKHEVVNGVYLWHLLKMKKLVKESRTRGDVGRTDDGISGNSKGISA
jgi:hypothetical protein